MKSRILIISLAATLVACESFREHRETRLTENAAKTLKQSTRCDIIGLNWKHSDKKLVKGLCLLSQRFGTVYITPHGSCRTKKSNKSVKRSFHLYSRGCKAADLIIKGVKGSTILKWWGVRMGGGRGFYHCRRFVHVDTGPSRTWSWNLCKRKRRKS